MQSQDAPPSKSNRLSAEDAKLLAEFSDKDSTGTLTESMIDSLVEKYNAGKITNAEVMAILQKYDEDGDGHIDHLESSKLRHELSLTDTTARYVGYSAVAARAFRYLAFTSDFGEALRPVANPRLVTGSYAVAFGYCFVDVGYEAYKHAKRGYVTEANEPRSLTEVVVERSAFQALASLIIPAALIHTTVDVAKKVTTRLNRFQRWGPSVAGLMFIPLLPLYIDHPVEHAIEVGFQRFGPWAKTDKGDKQH